MRDKRPAGNGWLIWTSVAIALMASYFGAYAAMVRPQKLHMLCLAPNHYDVVPLYLSWRYVRYWQPVKRFFAPAHEIDLWLRPAVWESGEDSGGEP